MKESSQERVYVFAGGGTGGHIYPALAVAEQLGRIDPGSRMMFLCSTRPIDASILSKTGYEYIPLAAQGMAIRPDKFFAFVVSQVKAFRAAKRHLGGFSGRAVVISAGGFASAPAVFAAKDLKMPIAILNVDYMPGRANTLLGRLASKIFVQFEETKRYFTAVKGEIVVSGCPLRQAFAAPNREKALDALGLDRNKKTLLVTGASSGSASINQAMSRILPQLDDFAETWQMVHLTGKAKYEQVKAGGSQGRLSCRIVDYWDDMPDLYAAADVAVGRAGGVSVAEYLAAGLPSICLPYPYHKDRHQYRNVEPLVRAGAARIVDDEPKDPSRTAASLLGQLREIMHDASLRDRMAAAAKGLAKPDAAQNIALSLRGLMDGYNSPVNQDPANPGKSNGQDT